MISNDFSTNSGYSSYDSHPRMIGDFDGDGLADIIGFNDNGTNIAFGKWVC